MAVTAGVGVGVVVGMGVGVDVGLIAVLTTTSFTVDCTPPAVTLTV